MEDADKLKRYQEIVRQTELALDAQLRLAISADQRGVYVATIFAAIASGLMAASGALYSTDKLSIPWCAGLVGGLICLLVAIAYALMSVKPNQVFTPGMSIDDWRDDIEQRRSIESSLEDIAEFGAKHIKHNQDELEKNAARLWWSLMLGFFAVPVALFLFAITALLGLQ